MQLQFVLGVVSAAFIDWLLEHIYWTNTEKWTGKFPYMTILPFLPPCDDLIVLAIFGIAYGLTKKQFALGGLLYSSGMVLHHTLLRGITRAYG